MLVNVITFAVIVLIIAAACTKLVIDKKKGRACSGCPHSRHGNKGFNCPGQ